jgi:hypothetical protein
LEASQVGAALVTSSAIRQIARLGATGAGCDEASNTW